MPMLDKAQLCLISYVLVATTLILVVLCDRKELLWGKTDSRNGLLVPENIDLHIWLIKKTFTRESIFFRVAITSKA